MARSESGRIVVEVDPLTKKKLYAHLVLSGSTLKEWFSTVAEEYCVYGKSVSLFQKDALIPPPTLSVGTSYRSQKKYSVVSMFSGCGGMDLGFRGGFEIFGKRYPKLPFEILWANDLNEAACRTYKRNLGDHIHCGDVWSLISKIPKKADVLIGGFPCQDISINGKGVGVSGARSGLYRAMVAAVDKLRPKVFVAENVRALLMKSRSESLKQVVRDFSDLGYSLSVQLYKAVDYGVPQIRERVFIVGVPKGRPNFIPPATERNRETWMTSDEAIGDLIHLAEDPAINHVWSRANVSPEQGNRKISAGKPAHTIRAECHGNIQFHYKLPRRLSMREAARIQTFPDNFIFDSKLRETERQVGNAVPPVLAWHIANAVYRNLNQDEIHTSNTTVSTQKKNV
ncbi:MAG: DNA cytosine methyltransferase [Gloeobacteraceae cyanobacterium ES-bin-144]|nr:DNA cytosine methyltransferase [Verrucomicrobiales bacterium]